MFLSFLKGEDLLGGEVVAIDGTKIRAQNSKSNNYNEAKLKKHLEYIEGKAASYIAELEQCDKAEDSHAAAELSKKQIVEKLKLLAQRKTNYEHLQKTLQDSGAKQISTVDADSRSLPIKDGITDVCYNVQSANDSKHSLVVDFDTINQGDQGQLSTMAIKAKAVLEVEALTVLADKGYHVGTDALEYIVQERNSQHRQQIVAEKQTDLFKDISKAKLFRYQEKGVLFVVKAGRCILADDMGLGKTLQAIVSTEVLRRQFKINTAIIICPTSLKYQWKTEIEKFTGNKNVCVAEGNILARKKLYGNNTADYVIVSYQMASNDFIYLNEMQADVLILDEAQRIKNWKTKTSAAIKRIKTTYALVLTGTPVENKIEDLYSLMQIVNPYLLGSLHNFLSRHQVTEDGTDKVIGYKNLNDVGVVLQDVMLRRTKAQVLKDLPKRMDKNIFVPLTTQQLELHTEYADKVARLVNKWKRMRFLSEEDRQNLLKFLNMMRMVSDSTFIIDQETNHQTKLDELQNILDEILAMPDEKVVIFSQWERMTRLVAATLKEQNIGFEYLHGGIPGKDRGKLYENFTNDKNCKIFLSTDAGGVGLNLQSAAYMINLDIPWNPAVFASS